MVSSTLCPAVHILFLFFFHMSCTTQLCEQRSRKYTVQGEITAHITSSHAYCRILAGGFSRCPNLFHILLLRISEYWYVFIRIGLNYLLHFIHFLGVLRILYILICTAIAYFNWY